MKIKTLQTNDLKTLEIAINTFNQEKKVKATQTHINKIDNKLIYTAIMYYE